MRILRLGSFLVPLLFLGACATTASVTPFSSGHGIGITLSAAENFFEAQGGGGWSRSTVNGSLCKPRCGDPEITGSANLRARAGSWAVNVVLEPSKVSAIILTLYLGSAPDATPQQAASLLSDAVRRFAPSAAQWAQGALPAILTNGYVSNASTMTYAGNTKVALSTGPADFKAVNLQISDY